MVFVLMKIFVNVPRAARPELIECNRESFESQLVKEQQYGMLTIRQLDEHLHLHYLSASSNSEVCTL